MGGLYVKLRHSWEKNWPEFSAAMTGGLPKFIFQQQPVSLGKSVPVFFYHVVSRQKFKADLQFLAKNDYTTLSADDLLDYLRGRRDVPERSVVLSFDDGAQNLYDIAFPLLKQYACKAVAFIAPKFHLHEREKNGTGRDLMMPLTWEQMQEMQTSVDFDFQSHTYEHRFVPRWPEFVPVAGADESFIHRELGKGLPLKEDLLLSRQIIEEKLNKSVRHLAFPMFRGSAQAIDTGRQVGYEAFWWGYRFARSGNKPGGSPLYIVRLDAHYLQRLPGQNRIRLADVFLNRYIKNG